MRIIHCCFAVLLLGSAPVAAQAPPDPAEAERVVQAYQDAFNRRDLAGVVAVFAPDAVLLAAPADTLARGVDQVRRAHKDSFQILPRVRVEVRARTVEGQTVVEERVYHGFPCNKAYAERAAYLVEAGRIRSVTITPLGDFAGVQITNADTPACFPPDGSGTSP
jgi:uncharacterized protein (TIGR02246 family)